MFGNLSATFRTKGIIVTPEALEDAQDPRGCRWIYGEVGESWHYCQRPVTRMNGKFGEQRDSCFCAVHHARAYIKPPQPLESFVAFHAKAIETLEGRTDWRDDSPLPSVAATARSFERTKRPNSPKPRP
jgi:hypothetical protein